MKNALTRIGGYLLSQVPGIAAGALAILTLFLNGWLGQQDRLAELRMEDFRAIAAQQEEFNQLLSQFTMEISTSGVVDRSKVDLLSANLVRQYSKVGAFSVGLDASADDAVDAYRSSLNDVKNAVITFSTMQDMDKFSMSLQDMYRKQKALTSVMEGAIGKAQSG